MTESLEKKVEQLDRSVRSLRKRLTEQDNEHRRDLQGVRLGLVAGALTGVLFALTAAVWGMEQSEYSGDEVITLWSLVSEGWFGLVTLVLVLAAGGGTLVAVADASRAGHITAAVLCAVLAVAVLFVSSAVEVADADGPGRWLTLAVALVLALVHGARAEDLRAHR